ncbi:MAG TPA: hypothetical protein VFR37_09345 [Longimicrobium sp.]|nr:hypothetical protein [Longimicrobium sp.]
MRPVIHRFRRAGFAAAVAGALAFGAGQVFAQPAAVVCNNPDADAVCYSLPWCDNFCRGMGSIGGGCYQGCCYCA